MPKIVFEEPQEPVLTLNDMRPGHIFTYKDDPKDPLLMIGTRYEDDKVKSRTAKLFSLRFNHPVILNSVRSPHAFTKPLIRYPNTVLQMGQPVCATDCQLKTALK